MALESYPTVSSARCFPKSLTATIVGKPLKPASSGLSWLERSALLVAIVEILLQIDKSFFLHEEDSLLGAVGGLNLSLTSFSLITLYAVWFADLALHRSRRMYRVTFGIPMLLYLAFNLLSAISATVPMLSVFDFAVLFQAYLLFFFLANRIETYSDVHFCLVAFAATLLTQGLIILCATAIGMNDDAFDVGPVLVAVHEGGRHAGTMHSPNLAGSTLALVWLPVAASLLLIRDRKIWWLMLLATSTGLFAILVTQSRGAYLTVAVGSLTIGGGMLYRSWLPKWIIPVMVLLGVIMIYPVAHFYTHRLQDGDRGSAASRMHLTMIAAEAISERPWMGHGAGNCHLAGQQIANQSHYRAEWYYTIHCKYLVVWVETGLFGLLAFLAVLATGLWKGFAVWLRNDRVLSALGLAIAAALTGHVLHMLVDIFNSRTIVQMLWCMLGLVAAIYKVSKARPAWSELLDQTRSAQPTSDSLKRAQSWPRHASPRKLRCR